MKLSVTKTREYVWRIGPFGDASMSSHNHITCWHVINDETGNIIAGGHSRGSNVSSGEAGFSRKKDAVAWMKGYIAASEGRLEMVGFGNAFATNASIKAMLNKPKISNEEIDCARNGAYEFAKYGYSILK